MTEDEAKTKWCPFARVASPMRDNDRRIWIGVAGVNRAALSPEVGRVGADDAANPESARCIGSGCMMWREITSFRADRLTDEVVGGFCGLAGAPGSRL